MFLQRQTGSREHEERCSTLLTTREMPTKTTMSNHLTPSRGGSKNIQDRNQLQVKSRRNWETVHCW